MSVSRRLFALCTLACCVCVATYAGKPRWVGNTPKELNDTYRFIEVVSYGSTIAEARMEAVQLLAQDEQLRKAVSVSVNTGNLQHINQQIVNGDMVETVQNNIVIETSISGQEYSLQAYPVDEYSERKNGQLKLYTLYMVGVANKVVFDRTYKTDRYGAPAVMMSVVPGLGQIYKGSTLKGVLMFAGTALCAGGILLCENQRADYRNKMLEQPKFAQTYHSKSSNWETGRNVCIGATAAVWLYNIVDAIAAKGARRVIVRHATGRPGLTLQLYPYATTEEAGLAFRYKL